MDFDEYVQSVIDSEAPETYYTDVKFTVRADSVWRTDRLVEHGGREVDSMKVGTKWTQFFDANDSLIARLPNVTEVKIMRKKETQESREDFDAWDTNRRIAKSLLEDYDTALTAARHAMNAQLDAGWTLRYTAVEDLLRADAEVKLEKEKRIALKYLYESDGLTLKEGFDEFIKEMKESVIKDLKYSRSTNMVSNLMDDIALTMRANMIEAARWY